MKKVFYERCAFQLVLVLLVGACVYGSTLNYPFIFDDEAYIVANPGIRDLGNFLHPSRAFSLPFLAPNFRDAFFTRITGSLSFALNYAVGGTNVAGYHLVNLGIHLASAMLVYLLLRLILSSPSLSTEGEAGKERYPLIPLFAALFFVCHPLQTQAVTYLSQRYASLATFFYLAAFTGYLTYRLSAGRGARVVSYTLALAASFLAMTTKEISFTLPALLLVAELLFFRGRMGKRLLPLIPFALTMGVIPLTLWELSVLQGKTGIGSAMNSLASTPLFSRSEYLFTQFRVLMTYLRLFLVPVGQNFDYDYPVYRSLFAPPVLASFVFLAALLGLALFLLYRSREEIREPGRELNRLISFGILWFFITSSIESSIIPIADLIFEHRMYLPSVGLFIALLAAISLALTRAGEGARRAVAALLAVLVLIYSGAAFARNRVWGDETRFWLDVKEKAPGKPRSYNKLGTIYYREGRFTEAEAEFKAALAFAPGYDELHGNLANLYAAEGRYPEALAEYRAALTLNPAYVEARYDLGVILMRQGDFAAAAETLAEAARRSPGHVGAHYNLARAFDKLGRRAEALAEYRAVLALDPGDQAARYGLESLLAKSGAPGGDK